jgi:hypothetical protein
MRICWKAVRRPDRTTRQLDFVHRVLRHARCDSPHTPRSSAVRSNFNEFLLRFLEFDDTYILDFPYFLDTYPERPMDFIMHLNFHYHALEMLTYANNPAIMDAILFVLSDFLAQDSALFLHQTLTYEFDFDGRRCRIADVLPILLQDASTDRLQSILCIAAQLFSITNDGFDFFVPPLIDFLKSADHQTVVFAATVSNFLIDCAPLSPLATHLSAELPFDSDNIAISHFCFYALITMISAGNHDCFDVDRLFELAYSPMVIDAIGVIGTAAYVSKDLCAQIAAHHDHLFEILTQCPISPKYVCWVVSNICVHGFDFAAHFLDFIPTLCGPIYDDADLVGKLNLATVTVDLMLEAGSAYPDDKAPVFEHLVDCLNLGNTELTVSLFDLFRGEQWASESLREALVALAEAGTDGMDRCAALLIQEIEERLAQEDG